jgi:hypothetical protein
MNKELSQRLVRRFSHLDGVRILSSQPTGQILAGLPTANPAVLDVCLKLITATMSRRRSRVRAPTADFEELATLHSSRWNIELFGYGSTN